MIRPYQTTDWAAICEVHDAARQDELRHSVGLAAFLTLEQTFENEGLFDGEVWVYELEGRAVGFMAINGNELTWLYVAPAHYRKGIAGILLQKAIDTTDGPIYTEVLCGNDAALAFYLHHGFEILEKKTGKLVGNEAFDAEGYYLKRG